MENKNELQEKVDRAKAIGLLNNIHNLSPPVAKSNENDNSVAIIDSLKVTPRLIGIFMELRGLMFLPEKKQYVQVARPIMNLNGAFRFIKVIQHISEEIEWSNFKEEEIDARIMRYFSTNYPSFTFWHEEYEIDPSDFGYIESTLMTFIDSSFHKAKSAKYVNAISKIYSEDFLSKSLGDAANKNMARESVLSKLNPFNKRK